MQCLSSGLLQQLRSEAVTSAVVERPTNIGGRYDTKPCPISAWNVRVVEDDVVEHLKPSPVPRKWEGEVNPCGEDIGQFMQCQRSVVRDNSRLFRPEPCDDEFVVLTPREVSDAIDASVNTNDATSLLQMMGEKGRRKASCACLLGREQPLLGGGNLLEAMPVWAILSAGHARKLSQA